MAGVFDRARESVGSSLSAFLSKLKSGDKTVVAATVATAAVAGYVVATVLLAPGDGEKYENDVQKAFPGCFALTVAPAKSINVEKISTSSMGDAAATLAASNRTDPMMIACSSEELDDAKRETALRWLYGVLLRSTVPSSYGALNLQTAGSKAVAIWYPGGTELSYDALLYNGALQYVWRFSGWDRRGRFAAYSTLIRAVKQRIMSGHEGSYFYLLTYGVKPELAAEEARNELTAVILPVLQRADALGQPCYVEVTDPKQVDFFKALNFKRVDEADPSTLFGTRVECMKREPFAKPQVAPALKNTSS